MRFTTVHINALIGLAVLALLAAGMLFILVRNDLSEPQFRDVVLIIGANIAGIVAVVKHFAGMDTKQVCPNCKKELRGDE